MFTLAINESCQMNELLMHNSKHRRKTSMRKFGVTNKFFLRMAGKGNRLEHTPNLHEGLRK